MRPPPPPAATSPAQLNGHMSTTRFGKFSDNKLTNWRVDKFSDKMLSSSHLSTPSPDPFSNVVSPAEAQNLFNNDDAFAAFNKDVSG